MTIKELQQRRKDQGTADNIQQKPAEGSFCISSDSPAIDQPTHDQPPETDGRTTRKRSPKRENKSVHTKEKKSVYTPAKVYTPTTPPEIIPTAAIDQQTISPTTPNTISNKQLPDKITPADILPKQTLDNAHQDQEEILPAGLYDDICASIEYYCQQHDINDIYKIHPIQWRAVCMSIGSGIKSRKLLFDMDYLKIKGGKKYDDVKVLALLFLYDRVCADYKQVAFVHNFPRFAGVSDEYVNNYMQRELTSVQCGLREKAYNLQRASLVGAVTGGGSATVGNIFLSKALAGLQETVTVQHVASAPAPSVSALPVFGDGGTLLPEK
jgi:hypothetical protein